jgi:hypothetical protein
VNIYTSNLCKHEYWCCHPAVHRCRSSSSQAQCRSSTSWALKSLQVLQFS